MSLLFLRRANIRSGDGAEFCRAERPRRTQPLVILAVGVGCIAGTPGAGLTARVLEAGGLPEEIVAALGAES